MITDVINGDTMDIRLSDGTIETIHLLSVDLPEIKLQTSYRVPEEHWDVATDILTRTHDSPGVRPVSTGDIKQIYSPELPSVGENSPRDLLPGSEGGNVETMYLARTKSQCRRIAQSFVDPGILFNASSGIHAWNRRNYRNHERVAVYNFCRCIDSINPDHVKQNGWNPDVLVYANDTDATAGTQQICNLPAEDAKISFQFVPEKYLTADHEEIDNKLTNKERNKHRIEIESMLEYTTQEFWDTFCLQSGTDWDWRLDQLLIDDDIIDWVRPALTLNINADSNMTSHNHVHTQIISDPQRQFDVTVRTIHASKGTEADRVILYDGITPAVRRSMYDSIESRANEHRVWFVGLTRSSSELYLVSDAFDYTDPILGDLL